MYKNVKNVKKTGLVYHQTFFIVILFKIDLFFKVK